ncbi:MAG: MBL fold metallo-hydrolase, partial [Anaerolineales bacterium]|nr:MBL fold metallo-hydrolase [Anaerolineales bacterium]
MFEILFLGTSASAPSARRGLSAQIVSHNEYRFLVDCGEGTQRQILQSGIGFKRLTRILLTHGHLDHILGLGGLLSTFLRWEAIDELEIYGGRQTLDRVHDLLYGVVLRGNQPPMPLRLLEIKPGLFFEAEDFTVTAFPVTHRGPDCLGYAFETKARRPFLSEKADAL